MIDVGDESEEEGDDEQLTILQALHLVVPEFTLPQALQLGSALQQQVALICARTTAVLRDERLPPECVALVAEMACSIEDVRPHLCSCTVSSQEVRQQVGFMDWMAPSSISSSTLVLCARCGKIRVCRCTPRVHMSDASVSENTLSPVAVGAGAVGFKLNRHFMLERAIRFEVDHCFAVRHRLSGLHSFRTILANEWIVRGRVTYDVHLELQTSTARRSTSLGAPAAVGIGCVTPSCDVNCDTAWAPGTRGWQGAWGVCIEEIQSEDSSLHEIRAIGPSLRAVLGGQCNLGVSDVDGTGRLVPVGDGMLSWCDPASPPAASSDPDGTEAMPSWEVRSGDVLRATIGRVAGAFAPAFALEIWRDGACKARCELRGLCSMGPDGFPGRREPLALAVALKYANDAVRVVRVE